MSRYIDFSVFGNAQTIEADLDSVIVVELDVCRDCFFGLSKEKCVFSGRVAVI